MDGISLLVGLLVGVAPGACVAGSGQAAREATLAEQRAAQEWLAQREKAAEKMLMHANAQFDGQHQPSRQDLETRRRPIDAEMVPLKKHLVRNEQVVRELGEPPAATVVVRQEVAALP